MGLDGVELVVEIEETFGLRIKDEDAEKILTVGDMHDTVWRYLSNRQGSVCHTQHVYYTLRRLLVNQYNLRRDDVVALLDINRIVDSTNRRLAYRNLEMQSGLDFPPLKLLPFYSTLLTSAGILLIGFSLLWSTVAIIFYERPFWLWLLPITGIIATMLLSKLLEPKRQVIYPGEMSVFTKEVTRRNFTTLSADKGVNRSEMETIINEIIVNKLGADQNEVVPTAKFADDLGMD